MNDQHVERIAVLAARRGNKTPVIGIGKPRHQRFRQRESVELRVELELGAAAARRFHNRMQTFLVGPGRKLGKVGHRSSHLGGSASWFLRSRRACRSSRGAPLACAVVAFGLGYRSSLHSHKDGRP